MGTTIELTPATDLETLDRNEGLDAWDSFLNHHPYTPPPLWSKEYWQRTRLASDNWMFGRRDEYVRRAGWCILTLDVAEILANFIKDKTVIELLAGTGYIAHHLRAMGGLDRKQYRAYDNRSSHQITDIHNYQGVTKKNARLASIKRADVVLISWPGYDSPLATTLLKKMVRGQYLIFNGEGSGGCTADDNFFHTLSDNFVELSEYTDLLDDHHVRWFGINDHWSIWKKVL